MSFLLCEQISSWREFFFLFLFFLKKKYSYRGKQLSKKLMKRGGETACKEADEKRTKRLAVKLIKEEKTAGEEATIRRSPAPRMSTNSADVAHDRALVQLLLQVIGFLQKPLIF